MAAKLPGPKVLLEGAIGTGKTHSLGTLVDAGLEVFVIATDNGVETLGKLTPAQRAKIHFKYVPPMRASWSVLRETGAMINRFNNDALQKSTDANRNQYVQILEIVDLMMNFKDAHGKSWGSVNDWGPERALVIDNLSGLNVMCRTLAVGGKPVLTQPDWGVSMDYELKFLKMACGLDCTFVLIAHIERELNEVTGGMKIMPGALGRKNAPQIPIDFSDVVLCYRENAKFWWSTVNSEADLKARNLPLSDKIEPSFVPLITSWRNSSSVLVTDDTPQEAAHPGPKP